MGFLREPPVHADMHNIKQAPNDNVSEIVHMANSSPVGVRLSFRLQLCARTAVMWEAVLLKNTLYLKPGENLPDGSKEAFIALLDYTETFLKCKHIYVCLKRNIIQQDTMARTFMFLGFHPVPANHPGAPRGNYLSLLYSFEDQDSDDEGY